MLCNADPRGAVLVIHENRGLNDHVRSVAGRFAAAGYSALALDLLSEEGGTAALGEVANATAALGNTPPERFVGDMRAALDELARRAPGAALGAIGFCFGGGMMWRLVASGDPRLVAVAPFYGTPPQGADFSGSNAAVLALYGALDTRVNATHADAEAALTAAGLTHELVTFPGANHASSTTRARATTRRRRPAPSPRCSPGLASTSILRRRAQPAPEHASDRVHRQA